MKSSFVSGISLLTLTTLGALGCAGDEYTPEVSNSATQEEILVEDQLIKLSSSGASAYDNFGTSLAVDGDTLVVGAHRDGSNTGSAYVYIRDGAGWDEQAKLTASDVKPYDYFGFAVDIDGDTAVIGAYLHDGIRLNGGAAYVFVREGSVWTQQAKLRASDAYPGQFFGAAVAIDGETIVVGAQGDAAFGTSSGAAYVFVRSGTKWLQQEKLMPLDGAPYQGFGRAVAIAGDTIMVGAEGDAVGGKNSGAAYVFIRNFGIWTEQDKLKAMDAAPNDNFGHSVALYGETAVVGAPYDDAAGYDAGAVFVYTRDRSAWLEQDKLLASDATGKENFGWHVAIEGPRIVVGAPRDDGTTLQAGSAYAYINNGAGWYEEIKLRASDGSSFDLFGFAVAGLSDMALVGAPRRSEYGLQSGLGYVFKVSNTGI